MILHSSNPYEPRGKLQSTAICLIDCQCGAPTLQQRGLMLAKPSIADHRSAEEEKYKTITRPAECFSGAYLWGTLQLHGRFSLPHCCDLAQASSRTMQLKHLCFAFCSTTILAVPSRWPASNEQPPLAHVKNGTYSGVHSPEYDQDFFLGVPFAKPPVADLRFRNPQSLDTAWSEPHSATQYSPACVGYGPSQMGYAISEDCLYLNVIRPAGIPADEKLPVLVWIYGGGFVQGSAVDLRYNMSFIVQQSQQMGQPMMAVALNYRLSAFGFLQGYDTDETDASTGGNWGIRDQRLALQWIQENVGAFGGEPSSSMDWMSLTDASS